MKSLIIYASIIVSFLLISNQSKAQDYQTAVGIKAGGYENGLSVKYFSTKDIALEGILGIRKHGVVITGLYEIHQQAFGLAELKFYYGAGAHIGAVGAGNYQTFAGSGQFYTKSQILLGADGVIGLEYIIPQSPIALSLDLNPRVELASGPFFDIAPGLGIKYTF